MTGDLVEAASQAFRAAADEAPVLTLRGGAALDGYDQPPPYDPVIDEPTDGYLELYAFAGLPYLDAPSWRHYLPRLIEYALRDRGARGGMVVEALLWSLRPPDRVPPRLASLDAAQEAVIVRLLDHLAFDEAVPEHELAMQVMEEWWLPDALYRPPQQEDF